MSEQVRAKQLIHSARAAFWLPGFYGASWAPFIPFIKNNLELGEQELGLLLMCMATGAVMMLPFANRIISSLGCRNVIRINASAACCCLIPVTFADSVYVLAAILIFMGANMQVTVIAANVNAAAIEKILKRNLMSGLHGIYSLANAAGVSAVTFMISSGFSFSDTNPLITAACCSVSVLLYCSMYACRHMLNNLPEEDESPETKAHKNSFKDFFHPTLFFMGLICLIMFTVEGAVLDWTGVFLHEVRGVSLQYTGYGFAAFAVAMTVCRLTGDRAVAGFGRRNIMITGALLVCSGLILIVTVPDFIVAVAGCAIIGVGASNLVPQSISYAATVKDMPMQRSVFIVNGIGFLGSLSGPALIGLIAEHLGLEISFMLLSAAALLVAVIAYFKMQPLHRYRESEKTEQNTTTADK